MRKLGNILALAALLFAAVSAAAAPTAQQVLEKAAARLSSASGISASFSIKSGGHSGSGIFKAQGSKFMMEAMGVASFYNGAFLWTYNPSTKEAVKSKPSPADLAEANPLVFVSGNYRNFNVAYGKSQEKGTVALVLTPKSKSNPIERATLTVRSSNYDPVKIVSKVNGQTVTITIKSVNRKAVPASEFEFSKSKYKNAKVIELK